MNPLQKKSHFKADPDRPAFLADDKLKAVAKRAAKAFEEELVMSMPIIEKVHLMTDCKCGNFEYYEEKEIVKNDALPCCVSVDEKVEKVVRTYCKNCKEKVWYEFDVNYGNAI